MKKNKHIITDISARMYLYIAAVVIISITVGSTLAYLAAKDDKTNTIKIDKGDTTISETFSEPTTLTLENVTQKEVKVHNNANTPCYVRVFVDFSDSEVRKRSLMSNAETGTYLTWTQFTTNSDPLTTAQQGTLQSIAPKWKYVETGDLGGYFYYTEPVEAGHDTDALFSYVKTLYNKQSAASGANSEAYISATNSEDFIKDFEIIVYSESVQTVDAGEDLTIDTTNGWRKAWTYFLTKSRPST